jgi:hypothetical protein
MLGRMGDLSVKHEDFCHLCVEMGNAVDAYMRVYDCSRRSASQASNRLMKDPRIIERIADIRGVGAEEAGFTIERMAKQLQEDRKFARENGNASAAVKASEALSKLLGFSIDRSVNLTMRPDEARNIIDQYLPGLLGEQP